MPSEVGRIAGRIGSSADHQRKMMMPAAAAVQRRGHEGPGQLDLSDAGSVSSGRKESECCYCRGPWSRYQNCWLRSIGSLTSASSWEWVTLNRERVVVVAEAVDERGRERSEEEQDQDWKWAGMSRPHRPNLQRKKKKKELEHGAAVEGKKMVDTSPAHIPDSSLSSSSFPIL